jgi:hypothetical protein
VEFIGRSRKAPFPVPDQFSGPIRKINAIHRGHALFHRGGNLSFVDGGHGAVLAAFREDDPGKGGHFLLLSNLDISGTHSLEIEMKPWRKPGEKLKLHELIEDRTIPVEGDLFRIELPPCGIRAYRFER